MYNLINQFYVSYSYNADNSFGSRISSDISSKLQTYAIEYIQDQFKFDTIKETYKVPSLISKLCQKYNLIDILWYIVPISFLSFVIYKIIN
jgi:hypothetical protein